MVVFSLRTLHWNSACIYESVIAFDKIHVIEDTEEKRVGLYALLKKYFADKKAGTDYRPITEQELKQTSVYKIKIENWSGKRNWEEETEQSDEWHPNHLNNPRWNFTVDSEVKVTFDVNSLPLFDHGTKKALW